MPRIIRVSLFLLCSLGILAIRGAPLKADPAGKLWPAVVAGQFYPADPKELKQNIGVFLAAAATEPAVGKIRAIIAPHAGYPFSGPVAAYAYKALNGLHFKRVFIIASNHNAEAEPFVLTTTAAGRYQTPLGELAVSPLAKKLLRHPLFRDVPKAHISHIIEVQLPFLQSVLAGAFEIIPIVTGAMDDKQLAEAVALFAPLLDEDSLLVISSDLSHYFPYEVARGKDIPCIMAIEKLNAQADLCDACGRDAIRILLALARERSWHGMALDYRNSGDTSGQKDRVVGYAALAFYAPAGESTGKNKGAATPPPAPVPLAPHSDGLFPPLVRRELLHMARQILDTAVLEHRLLAIPMPPMLASLMEQKRGCFVTLKRRGELRGCIGELAPQRSPVECIEDNVQNAAFHDPRFPVVHGEELEGIDIEISILTQPEPLAFSSPGELLKRLEPGKHGVILAKGGQSATFLPQVWEDIPVKEEFLGALCRKAGLPGSAWRDSTMAVFTYGALVFGEKR